MELGLDFEKKLEHFTLRAAFDGEKIPRSLPENETIGILGASGCGKSMTLKCIAGIETPDRGTIRLGDRVLFGPEVNQKPQQRRVGYLFQNYALFPNMTVEQNIMAGVRQPKAQAYRKAGEMAEQFLLKGLEKRYPAELSGGQQQRCALARMLAADPQLLLFDEPFSALDGYLKERLRLELAETLKRFQKPAIIVTHDREEAYQLCSRLILMKDGQFLEAGPAKEIFSRPKTVEGAILTGCKNLSRIEKRGSRRVYALDWGLELELQDEVGEEITHVGIRAHDLIPLSETSSDQREADAQDAQTPENRNRIPVRNASVTELPFEWYILLENGIWWKLPKNAGTNCLPSGQTAHHPINLPSMLYAPPESILMLRK